jgi:hypothetical protein
MGRYFLCRHCYRLPLAYMLRIMRDPSQPMEPVQTIPDKTQVSR